MATKNSTIGHIPYRAARLNGTSSYWSIVNVHGGCIATTDHEKQAATVVAALNAHDDLVAALERILKINGSTGGPASVIAEYKHIARTALAKVQS